MRHVYFIRGYKRASLTHVCPSQWFCRFVWFFFPFFRVRKPESSPDDANGSAIVIAVNHLSNYNLHDFRAINLYLSAGNRWRTAVMMKTNDKTPPWKFPSEWITTLWMTLKVRSGIPKGESEFHLTKSRKNPEPESLGPEYWQPLCEE